MADDLLTGQSGPLTSDEGSSIQGIADALAGAGLHNVLLRDLNEAATINALAAHLGNRTHAAKALGISVRTLQRTLKLRGLQRSCASLKDGIRKEAS